MSEASALQLWGQLGELTKANLMKLYGSEYQAAMRVFCS